MRDLYFEAFEEAWAALENDGSFCEPSDEAIQKIYQDKLDRLADAADNARKVAREAGA